ncbi:MAG: hypothetical protein AAB565_00430 [Patescibacteria group bacterium]
MISEWTLDTAEALGNLWQGFIQFIPSLIGALLIFIIGWFVAVGLGKIIAEILSRIQFNKLFESSTWKKAMDKAEVKTSPSEFIGTIVKWVFTIVVLQVAVGILGWTGFEGILEGVVDYLPNVVVAAFIFVVAVIIADIVAKLVVITTEGANFVYSHLAGEIVRWSIWIFAILIILHQLGVAQPLVETLFTGLVAILVISFGLAFGLGGKDTAAAFLGDLRKRIKG